ncbi:hypothetical protein IWX47DRAFT_12813 [Phyllosticta citricarpa]|uniref:Uncharacterized protein n=1 Tax=Phyllosticta citricarpa TaxID=55181 RepID=A0ABR1MH64_9PEZI
MRKPGSPSSLAHPLVNPLVHHCPSTPSLSPKPRPQCSIRLSGSPSQHCRTSTPPYPPYSLQYCSFNAVAAVTVDLPSPFKPLQARRPPSPASGDAAAAIISCRRHQRAADGMSRETPATALSSYSVSSKQEGGETAKAAETFSHRRRRRPICHDDSFQHSACWTWSMTAAAAAAAAVAGGRTSCLGFRLRLKLLQCFSLLELCHLFCLHACCRYAGKGRQARQGK